MIKLILKRRITWSFTLDYNCSVITYTASKKSWQAKLFAFWDGSNKGVFFFHYYFATSTTDWAQIFTGLLFYACWDTLSEKTNSVQCLLGRNFMLSKFLCLQASWDWAHQLYGHKSSILILSPFHTGQKYLGSFTPVLAKWEKQYLQVCTHKQTSTLRNYSCINRFS